MTSPQIRKKKPTGLGPMPRIDPNFAPLASPKAPRPAATAPRAKPRPAGKPRKRPPPPPPRKTLGTIRFVLTALGCMAAGMWVGYEAQAMVKATYSPETAVKVVPGPARPGGSSAFTF
ncbi:hypothetical protein BSY19_4916 (plasmid) [Bosea sp. RAC05]|nr:hypothetical protein BSY19_4916 [Bosea sp. RAC05]